MINPGNMDFLANSTVLITGGTGSLGTALVRMLLERSAARKIIIFSRDEYKQFTMRNAIPDPSGRLRFFLGDIRDPNRLHRAFEGVDYLIHAAALKHVPAAEYDPFEFIKTNVVGSENVINAAIDANVKRTVALSTDKAANPINMYGATKLCSDKLFVAANSYSGLRLSRFAVVRYGNVLSSRGSVVPFFQEKRPSGVLPITDFRMTRFWITITQAATLVLNALRSMLGGEIFVPRIPSMRITDLAKAIGPECELKEIGIRPGEKLHEVMIPMESARTTVEFPNHYVIAPDLLKIVRDLYMAQGKPCREDFQYSSDQNDQWITTEELRATIEAYEAH